MKAPDTIRVTIEGGLPTLRQFVDLARWAHVVLGPGTVVDGKAGGGRPGVFVFRALPTPKEAPGG